MHRLVILLDNLIVSESTLLTRETLRTVSERTDVEVVAVCVRKPKRYHRLLRHRIQSLFSRRTELFLGREPQCKFLPPAPLNLQRLARHDGFRVLVPSSADFNHPTFLAELETVVRPTMALTFLCGQRFGARLLETLRYPVNYHNGALPRYRGVYATSWSRYHGESQSGFAFHLMETQLDQGPVLLEGSVPIHSDVSVWDLEWEKAVAASTCLPRLLEMMVNHVAGTPQQGQAQYFSGKAGNRMRTISNPAELSSAEIARRLQAFGSLYMLVGGDWYRIGELKRLDAPPVNRKHLWLQAADGGLLQVTRFQSCEAPSEATENL